MLALEIPDESCPECGEQELYYSTKEESSIWKIYTGCSSCGRDFGRIGVVKRKNIGHVDEVEEKALEKAQRWASR